MAMTFGILCSNCKIICAVRPKCVCSEFCGLLPDIGAFELLLLVCCGAMRVGWFFCSSGVVGRESGCFKGRSDWLFSAGVMVLALAPDIKLACWDWVTPKRLCRRWIKIVPSCDGPAVLMLLNLFVFSAVRFA